MKKILCIITVLAMSVMAFAQNSKIPQTLEIAQIENEQGDTVVEVFNMPKDGQNHYYLDLGTLGFGDEYVQVYFDPVHRLYIPLGDNLTQVLERLQEMKDLFKTEPGTTSETLGCLAFPFPTDKLETVKITSRRIIVTRELEFSVEREKCLRATRVSKSDFNSLVTSVKLYSKIHPKER